MEIIISMLFAVVISQLMTTANYFHGLFNCKLVNSLLMGGYYWSYTCTGNLVRLAGASTKARLKSTNKCSNEELA